jgi:hypothetical protein
MASCHVGHTGSHFITEVKQIWAQLVLGWVIAQMTNRPGVVIRCTRILWPVEDVGEDTESSYSACLREISQNVSRKVNMLE